MAFRIHNKITESVMLPLLDQQLHLQERLTLRAMSKKQSMAFSIQMRQMKKFKLQFKTQLHRPSVESPKKRHRKK